MSARCFPPFVVAGLLFVIEILMSFRTQRSVWCLVAFVYLVVYRPDLKGLCVLRKQSRVRVRTWW